MNVESVRSFRITGGKGFHLTFPNGVTVSTQFGAGNYGDNYDSPIWDSRSKSDWAADKAEVAIWVNVPEVDYSTMTNWITEEYEPGDSVLGYKNMEEWLKLIDWARNYVVDKPRMIEKAKANKAEREAMFEKYKSLGTDRRG